MRNQGRGTSVAFLSHIHTIPPACKSFMHFPTHVWLSPSPGKPRSQARIRSHNNKLTSCSCIVSCQMRGRGSRATGPLGHPRDSPKTPNSSVAGLPQRPLIVISARLPTPPPPPPWCPGKQNGPDSFIMRSGVQREQASDFQIHCPC